MANYINTLTIEPQSSAEALCTAFAQALGEALGLSVSGAEVVHGSGLKFCFTTNNSNVYLRVGKDDYKSTTTSLSYVSYSGSTYYSLDYIKTANTVAVGIRKSSGSIMLNALLTVNSEGVFKAISLIDSKAYMLAENWSATKSYTLSTATSTGISTSLVKFPDIWGGCMFKDLYLVISCPLTSTDKVIYCGGKYFRYVGSNGDNGFAVLVG